MVDQKQERSLLSSASGKSFSKDGIFLKTYNGGRRCLSAGAKKEVPGKPIGGSFKQNLLDKLLSFSFLGEYLLGG